jgi:hypothetical protein
VGNCEGWALPTLFYPDSFLSFTEDSYCRALTGRAVIGKQPAGSPAVAVTGRTRRPTTLLERYGAVPSVLGYTFGVVLPSRSPTCAKLGGRDGLRAADVYWRCDER